jgi:hypothetical protein
MIRLASLYAVANPSTGDPPKPPPAIPSMRIACRALAACEVVILLALSIPSRRRARGVATDQVRGRYCTPQNRVIPEENLHIFLHIRF